MNKDQVEGALEKAKGSVKESVGKMVGNDKLEAEGAGNKAAGTVQKKWATSRKLQRTQSRPSADPASVMRLHYQ